MRAVGRRGTPLAAALVAFAALATLAGCGREPAARRGGDTSMSAAAQSAPRTPTRSSSRAGAGTGVPTVTTATHRNASALHVLVAPRSARRALEPLDDSLRVEVFDPRGRPQAGHEVTWRVVSGGGSVSPAVSVTDGSGVATASWTPGASAGPQLLLVGLPGIGDVELQTSVAVAGVRILPDPVSLWPGDSVALRADLADEAGHSLAGGTVHWSAADPTTARVTPDGYVVGVRAGSTRVVGDAGPARDTTTIEVVPTVAGRLFTADGAPAPAARVVVRAEGRTDSLSVASGGTFALRLRRTPWDSVDVIVTPADPRYYPARLRLGEPREMGDVGIVLLPRSWTTTGPTFGGRTISISPSAAIARSADGGRFWRLERAEPRSTWMPAGWRRALLPVRVSFSQSRGERVSAGDSAAFWRIARALERDLGARLFEPGPDPGEEGQGTIHVVVDPSGRDPGFTVASWNAVGMIGEATIFFRSAGLLSDPTVVTHELLHAIGMGHTSSWPSIMNPGGTGAASLTPNDVAYAQLLLALLRVQEANGAPYGVAEAAAGERGGVAPPTLPDARDRARTP